jgi:cytochrome b involved in lipid metabolism
MGWIRLGLPKSPAKQLHSVAARVEVDNITDATHDFHKSAATKIQQDKIYPFQSPTAKTADLPFIEASEVAKRTGEDRARLWIVVDNTVLDVTQYLCSHPGGQQIVRGFGGQECSWQWWTFHNRKVWNEVASTLRVGRTEGIENRHVKPKAFVGLRGLGYQEDWS